MQIFPAARLSRRVYRIVICYRSMRVKRGKPVTKIPTVTLVAGVLVVLGVDLPRFQCTAGISRALGGRGAAYLGALQFGGLPVPFAVWAYVTRHTYPQGECVREIG